MSKQFQLELQVEGCKTFYGIPPYLEGIQTRFRTYLVPRKQNPAPRDVLPEARILSDWSRYKMCTMFQALAIAQTSGSSFCKI